MPRRPAPSTPSRGRRVSLVAGIALIVAGVVLGGWVGWQLVGTNVVAHRSQQKAVAETVEMWAEEDVNPTSTIEGVALPPPATGTEPALVRIPRFGRSYVVPIRPGVSDDVLAEGFGHFRFSASPGGYGNYALAAHRVTHGEPLRHVLDLRPGDKVLVSTLHWTYVYRLDTDPRRLRVTNDGVWVVDFHPVNPHPGGVNPVARPRLLTLVTCAELFHTNDRTVVFGHLVGRHPRA